MSQEQEQLPELNEEALEEVLTGLFSSFKAERQKTEPYKAFFILSEYLIRAGEEHLLL